MIVNASRGRGEGEVIDALDHYEYLEELGKTTISLQELFGALLALALSSRQYCLVTETEPREKTDENLQFRLFICCRNSIFNFCSE